MPFRVPPGKFTPPTLPSEAAASCSQLNGDHPRPVNGYVGRALAKKPTFCFADEPMGALDPASGERVIELLRDAAHKGNAAVLVVAHDERIIPHADRVFHLADGQLPRADGSAVDVAQASGWT